MGAAVLAAAAPALAASEHLEVPPEAEVLASPAYRYANMEEDAAVAAELDRRGVPYRVVDPKPVGVRQPIRLTGPLHGVDVHSSLAPAERRDSVFEIMDARLALALDDFCAVLARHDVVELVHFTIYRPGPSNHDDGAAQTRHPGGMAIDVGALKKRSGQWLTVQAHWPAQVGAKTCGAGARRLEGDHGRELVSMVCEAADDRIFQYMLTPHFNAAHADHLHLEIKPSVKWFLVH